MSWVRAALILALVVGLVASYQRWVDHLVGVGDQQGAARVQALWDRDRLQQQEALSARQAEQAKEQLAMFRNAERVSHEDQKRTQLRADRSQRADAAVERLRNTTAQLDASDLPTPDASPRAASLARQASTARELLGSCGAAYRELGQEADRLRDQVAGLQQFVAGSCPAAQAQPIQ
jgi:hypothetical protein